MAARTPTTLYRASLGSETLLVANFAASGGAVDEGDTWATGLTGILSVMACQATAAGTQTSTGAGAEFSGTTVTFHVGENDNGITLWVLGKA